MMGKKHIQRNFDFSSIQVVKNLNCEAWHIQRSNGLSVENTPTYFETEIDAIEYARTNGIKLSVARAEFM